MQYQNSSQKIILGQKKKLNYIILRYFNVAGSDLKLRSGNISKKKKYTFDKENV